MNRIESVETYFVDLQQEQPYLGSLRDGETVNESGYFVRRGNRTVYPRKNRSLVVRILTSEGIEGWGETYGLVAPQATAAIINDLLIGFLKGRDPAGVESLHDELYDLMRVRGYTGGFYLDALAAIDIALWDIVGKQSGKSVSTLIGERRRDTIPAYVSGLPADSLGERCDLAKDWQTRGFDSFKFAHPVADQGPVRELAALRERLGDDAEIACDMHWAFQAEQVLQLAQEMTHLDPWFLEAPVATEDIDALHRVANHSGQRIAVGEEWRTIHEAKLRIDRRACHIVQPEMGHTGITQFLRIGQYAAERGLQIIPHATIGSGIFLAASLQASAVLDHVTAHEYQHSVFDAFRRFTGERLTCNDGVYGILNQPGLGVEPSKDMLAAMTRHRT